MQDGPVQRLIPTNGGQVGATGSLAVAARLRPNWLKEENLDKAIAIVRRGNEEIRALCDKYKDKKDNPKNILQHSTELRDINKKIDANLDKL